MTTAAAADDHSKHDTTAEVQEVYLLILLPSLVSKITITEWKAHDFFRIRVSLLCSLHTCSFTQSRVTVKMKENV